MLCAAVCCCCALLCAAVCCCVLLLLLLLDAPDCPPLPLPQLLHNLGEKGGSQQHISTLLFNSKEQVLLTGSQQLTVWPLVPDFKVHSQTREAAPVCAALYNAAFHQVVSAEVQWRQCALCTVHCARSVQCAVCSVPLTLRS